MRLGRAAAPSGALRAQRAAGAASAAAAGCGAPPVRACWRPRGAFCRCGGCRACTSRGRMLHTSAVLHPPAGTQTSRVRRRDGEDDADDWDDRPSRRRDRDDQDWDRDRRRASGRDDRPSGRGWEDDDEPPRSARRRDDDDREDAPDGARRRDSRRDRDEDRRRPASRARDDDDGHDERGRSAPRARDADDDYDDRRRPASRNRDDDDYDDRRGSRRSSRAEDDKGERPAARGSRRGDRDDERDDDQGSRRRSEREADRDEQRGSRGTVAAPEAKRSDDKGAPPSDKTTEWEVFRGKDAFAGSNAHEMDAGDIADCRREAVQRGCGGFVVWKGRAYLRRQPPGELKAALRPVAEATTHIAPESTYRPAPATAVLRPERQNRVKMLPDGWDEYDPEEGTLVKSVRKGKVVWEKKVEQKKVEEPPQTYQEPTESDDGYDKRTRRRDPDPSEMPDPWKPDDNGQWYSAVSGQPVNMDKYLVYPGEGKHVNEVLKEMECDSQMTWKPKRNRKPIIVLDSKWSGWHEVQWDGQIIKTLREKGKPHPESPESLKGTPQEEEFRAIRAKIDEEKRREQLAKIAEKEQKARTQPPQDDQDFDGKRLIELVNSSDNMLIRAYLVYKFMERKNLVASTTTFNSLLTAAMNTCQLHLGFNVWRMMMSRGILPDNISYNTLITLCGKSGQKNMAYKVFEEMQQFRLDPDEVTYQTLIHIDSRRAYDIVRTNHDAGKTVPDGVLMRVYCEKDDDKAFEIWNKLLEQRRAPEVDDYNHILLLCERRNDYKQALNIFNDMEERQVPPNFLTYQTVMNMMAVNGQLEQLHKIQTMMHERRVTTLVVLSTFKFAGKDTSIVNGMNIDLSVSIDVPTFDGEQDIAMALLTEQMVQLLESETDYSVNFKGLPTYTLMHLSNEYNQRASLQYHCEKKSLSYLLLKHGRTPEGRPARTIPRINVNARMCMDCHDVFAAASTYFNVSLECNDNSMLHHFHSGRDLSCEDGWRTRDAMNVPGSGQYGGGL
eukprot:TRINITY_DN51644_c0_g1_i1.p1 TRINITY_DN51644_c0_g1~~TRINITY_DN51644_c0_g1_i1.p1  ORF type:complete len:1007 (+),score=332.25 TRINITY_DN51644_c0_g1_i1:75-3095(+)